MSLPFIAWQLLNSAATRLNFSFEDFMYHFIRSYTGHAYSESCGAKVLKMSDIVPP